jgi:hypothetical protein
LRAHVLLGLWGRRAVWDHVDELASAAQAGELGLDRLARDCRAKQVQPKLRGSCELLQTSRFGDHFEVGGVLESARDSRIEHEDHDPCRQPDGLDIERATVDS